MPYGRIFSIGQMTLEEATSMDNLTAYLDMNNVVYFCGNATLTNYTAEMPFATLPDDAMVPSSTLLVPICVTSDGATRLTYLIVDVNGELSLPFDYQSATVHMDGISFTVNDRYYTPEIGNVYPNNTSPMPS